MIQIHWWWFALKKFCVWTSSRKNSTIFEFSRLSPKLTPVLQTKTILTFFLQIGSFIEDGGKKKLLFYYFFVVKTLQGSLSFFLDLRITRWKEDCKVSLMLSSFSTTTLPRPICQEKIHESRDQHGIFFPFILECQKLSMYIGQQLSSYMVWSYPLLWLEGTFMRLYSVLLYFFPNCRLWKRDKDTVQFIKIVLF